MSSSFLRRSLAAVSTIALTIGLISLPGAALGSEADPLSESTEITETVVTDFDDVDAGDFDESVEPVYENDSVSYTGTIVRISHTEKDADSTVHVFQIAGYGLLVLDFVGVPGYDKLDLSKRLTVTVKVPSSVALSEGDLKADFMALSEAMAAGDPLTVIDAKPAKEMQIAAKGNVSPAYSATHKVYAVFTAPRYHSNGANPAVQIDGPNSMSESALDVQNAIAYADEYWQKQSHGKVKFEFVGSVAPFQRDTVYNCFDHSDHSNGLSNGFAGLVNRQAARTDYNFEPNTHLVMIFPPNTNCKGTAGLGSVGWSVNQGGYSWNIGAASSNSKTTIAHELGHNLTLGHSNWMDCSTAAPVFNDPGYDWPLSCDNYPYGDVIDVMGFGQNGKLAGATSAVHLIRAGLWTEGTHYAVAKANATTTHTLTTMSGYAGKRAVIVTDNYGNDFVVEFRDYTGDDSGYTAGVNGGSILVGTPGVRIHRLENFGYYQKGFPGDDSWLMGRTVSSVKRADFKVGETFSHGGVKVAVQGISGGKAVVKITRAKHTVRVGTVNVIPPIMHEDGTVRVGDVLQATLGDQWRADSYSYQWYRYNPYTKKTTTISGATKQHYTLKAADLYMAIKVKVTGKISGQASKSKTSATVWSAEAPGYIEEAGTVEVIHQGRTTLLAKVGGWIHVDPPLAYQWYRDGKAIKGATKSTYKPVTADRNKNLHVKVTFNSAGYFVVGDGTTVATSTPAKYSIAASKTPRITGSVRVGSTLTIDMPDYTQGTGGAAITPTLTYQWYRDGKAISKATKATYTPTATDHGKRITVKVTAKHHSLLALSQTSAKTAKVATGVIAGTRDVPVVTKAASPSRKLTATLPAGSITTSGTKVVWQWLRDGKAINKATKSTYTPTTADYGKQITVRATITKSKYSTVKLVSVSMPSRDSIILDDWSRWIIGDLKVGEPLSIDERFYFAGGDWLDPGEYTEKFQWMRDGKAIKNATDETYTPVMADIGKKLTVKITFSKAGYLGSSKTSVATPKVGLDTFAGGPNLQWQYFDKLPLDANVVSGKIVVSAPPPGVGPSSDAVPDLTAKRTYQWLRNGATIKGATKATYTPVAADVDKRISVRISITKSGYSEVIRMSQERKYTVYDTPKPTITGTAKVGKTLTAVTSKGWVTPLDGSPNTQTDVEIKYQWLRNGEAISGATKDTYKLKSADKGKQISVKVTQSHPDGFVSAVKTSSKTKKVT